MESKQVSFNTLDELLDTLCNDPSGSTITFESLQDRLENYSINRLEAAKHHKGKLPEFMTYEDLKRVTNVADDKLKDLLHFDIRDIKNYAITDAASYKKFCKQITKWLQNASSAGNSLQWKSFSMPGSDKQAANKSLFPQGQLFGLGTQSSGTMLIKGIKAGFVGVNAIHEQTLKDRIQEKISELEKDTKNLKKTTQLSIMFDIVGSEGVKQSDQIVENMKILTILRILMCKKVHSDEGFDGNTEVDYLGFLSSRIGKKFVNGKQSGTEWLWSFKCVSKSACMPNGKDKNGKEKINPYNVPVDIYRLEKENPLSLTKLNYRDMSVQQLCQMLSRQEMDIEIVIDSCGVTQKGTNVQLTPKLRITKIFLKSRIQKYNQTFGLQLPGYIVNEQSAQDTQLQNAMIESDPNNNSSENSCDDDVFE